MIQADHTLLHSRCVHAACGRVPQDASLRPARALRLMQMHPLPAARTPRGGRPDARAPACFARWVVHAVPLLARRAHGPRGGDLLAGHLAVGDVVRLELVGEEDAALVEQGERDDGLGNADALAAEDAREANLAMSAPISLMASKTPIELPLIEFVCMITSRRES